MELTKSMSLTKFERQGGISDLKISKLSNEDSVSALSLADSIAFVRMGL